MLANLTFCRSEMGGGMDFWGGGWERGYTRTKFDNVLETYANTPNRMGWGEFLATL